MKYKDAFLGEIELTKIGDIPNWSNEIRTIYVHEKTGDYYIHTIDLIDFTNENMQYIRKKIVDIIIDHRNKIDG